MANYINRKKSCYAGNGIHCKANSRKVDRRTAGKDYRSGPAHRLLIDESGSIALDRHGKPIRREVN